MPRKQSSDTKDPSARPAGPAPEQTPEQTSEQTSEQTPEQPTEQPAWPAPEQTSQQASEQTPEQPTEQPAGPGSEQPTGPAPELHAASSDSHTTTAKDTDQQQRLAELREEADTLARVIERCEQNIRDISSLITQETDRHKQAMTDLRTRLNAEHGRRYKRLQHDECVRLERVRREIVQLESQAAPDAPAANAMHA